MGVLQHLYLKARCARIPLYVHFDFTYRCLQRYPHCCLPESWRQSKTPQSELNTAEIHNILDQLAAVGNFFLTFSGGDIFLPGSIPGGCDVGISGCHVNPSEEIWPCVDLLLSCGRLEGGESFKQIWNDSPRNSIKGLVPMER